MKKDGIRWRKKAWEQTPDLSKHKLGVMNLWGKRVPALDGQFSYYCNLSKIPDKLHSLGLIDIIVGLAFQFDLSK